MRETAGREVGGRPLALPMVDIHTVGAGGGSIAWRDAGRRAARRPALARAPSPGPRATAAAATEPTVTDANLVLGRLDAGAPLAGGVALDAEAARARGRARWRDALGLDADACARGHRARRRTPRWSARCA